MTVALAATHGTSMAYEIKNTLYHMIEQGIGGLIVFYVYKLIRAEKRSKFDENK